jgi:hypothetical protein
MVYAAFYELVIYKNATFNPSFTWQDNGSNIYDLSGYTGKMEIRQSVDSPNPPAISLTTSNGGMILSSTSPNITLFISDVNTEAIVIPSGVYSLLLKSPGGIVSEILHGKVKIISNPTKS